MSAELKLKSNAGGSVSIIVDDTLATDETVNACGVGQLQTWQDMTAERTDGITYTNDTGKPIAVFILSTLASVEVYYSIVVDGETVDMYRLNNTDQKRGVVRTIVPSGQTYSFSNISSTAVTFWKELRG